MIRKLEFKKEKNPSYQFHDVELVFGVLMVFIACAMAFAHDSNNVGPVAAIVSIIDSGGQIEQEPLMSVWILLLGAIGIIAGLLMYGHKVIATVGSARYLCRGLLRWQQAGYWR